MAAPGDSYAFELAIAVQAGANFKARKKQRELKTKAVEEGQYTKAETNDRLAKRVNRLLDAVKERVAAPGGAVTALPDEVHELIKQDPVKPEDVDNVFVERVIGATRDFLAVGFFEKGTIASRAVCRIITNIGAGRRSMGTGFLVTPSLLMTNEHVLKTADLATRSTAEFNYQLSGTGATLAVERFGLRPDVFFINDKDLDFALVAVEQRSANRMPLASFGCCPLIGAEGKIIVQDPVNIVQHPKGELKQIVIRNNTLLDLPDAPLDKYAHYQTDTEQGSSGSPVFNDQWEVIALHHSSVPRMNANNQVLDRQGKVWPQNGDPDDIDWISNEGIRTSRLVKFINTATVREHEKRLQDEFMAYSSGNAPVVEPPKQERVVVTPVVVDRPPQPVSIPRPKRSSPPVRSSAQGAPARGTISLTVPLTVTIGFGSPHDGVASAAVIGGASADAHEFDAGASEASIQPDPDYASRPGFDPDFLGIHAPLPGLLPEVKDLAIPVGNGIELKYYHYSVIMNSERKIAFVSAVNLDAGAPFQLHREAKDRWFFDPRVDHDEQIGGELYVKNPLDRGHLTRRADAAWGNTEEEAQLANDDTFHWTNCSPQHEVFNQSSKANAKGLLLWGTLENHVAEQAADDARKKVSVFNGPIFRKNDRIHRGVKVPREFYKLIVYVKDDGTAGAVAFILSQESLIKNLPAEDFEIGPYQPFQVKISDLQARTGLDFGALAGFDPLAGTANEAFVEGATADVLAVRSVNDIVL